MAKHEGKCPRCGRTYYTSKEDIVVCDCWKRCPVCGAEMTQYTPDSALNNYGIDGKRDLAILMTCTLHSPPFFSQQKPVEVVFT